ncbi:MAG: dienelactone hydrolase family protein [Thermoplasmata archaeon]|nr:dienelactone hydrolase family protein [Thermoplasmata archaeon]
MGPPPGAPYAYLATPSSGRGRGVVIFHAWWGLNPFFRELADRLAGEGYTALAPDLYDGKLTGDPREAEQLRTQLDFDRSAGRAKAAVDFLLTHPAVSGASVGTLGCSMGGAWAMLLTDPKYRADRVDAAVTFYGYEAGIDFPRTTAAYLGHFAEDDRLYPTEKVREWERDLRATGRDATFHIHPGTRHGFFEADRPDTFHPGAAASAWTHTLDFLRTRLPPPRSP